MQSTDNSELAFLYREENKTFTHTDRVSVVIVTFNKYNYVRDLLVSFQHINYDKDLLDIIVVDNASNDETEEKLIEEFGETITLIQTGENLGGSGGFNTGMKFAMEYHDNEYIWLVDNDAVVHVDALNYLLESMKANPKAAAIGSMILQLDNPEYVSEIGAMMDWSKGRIVMQNTGDKYTSILDKSERILDYCPACSLLKRRSALEDIGFWEEYFIHFDDVDWCLRAVKKGYQIICNPKSITFHESMNQKQPTWIRYYNIRNLLYTYAKFKPLRLPFVFLKFFLGACYFLGHGLKKNSGLVFKALWDFLRGKKAKQDFPLEDYQKLEDFNWADYSNENSANSILIFNSRDNLNMFIEKTGFQITDTTKILVYPKKKNFFSLWGIGYAQDMASLSAMFKNKKVIIDGDLEYKFMFPCPVEKLVVYSFYGTMLDLRIR